MTFHSHPPPQQQPTRSAKMGSVGRELKLIASSFVKQYYTLLNKAPCFIHNFYNHDSTFIHGTIEMGSDDHTDPVVGREKIEEKMKELQLNDCRAKIKQIDCLETLAGGLVLQVIGELSNDGKPMRRFLQTFVLAPSPDQVRHDGDPHNQSRANDNRRGVQISENGPNSSHNQKFYVLNSIFRYQDDGPDSEFEDDSISAKANTSVESCAEQVSNDGHNMRVKTASAAHSHVQQQQLQPQSQPQLQQQQQPQQIPQQLQQQQQKVFTPVEQPKNISKPPFVSELAPSSEQQKRGEVKVVASNGTINPVRKSEISEKPSNENGKVISSDSQLQTTPMPTNNAVESNVAPAVTSQTSSTSAQAPAPAANVAPVPKQPNEPKTWANMVRNALPSTASTPATQSGGVAASKEQSSYNQSNQAQNPSQQQQIPHQHHHQQQSLQSQNDQQQNNSMNNNNTNNSNNRRRHMIRKTSNNKAGNGNGIGSSNGGNVAGTGGGTGGGRMIKNRPPRPAPAAAPMSKPAV